MKSKLGPMLALLLGSFLLVGAQDDAAAAAAKAEKAAKAAAAKAEAAAKFKAGFDRLRFIEGKWLSRDPKSKDPALNAWTETEIAPYMGGKYLEMHGHLAVDFQILFAYNQPGSDYIMSIVDSGSGVIDIYHGTFDASGKLTLTNPQFYRVSLVPAADGQFSWVGEYSPDKGTTWKPGQTFEFKKAP